MATNQSKEEGSFSGGDLTDEQLWELWLFRKNIHGGDLKPQLLDFARAAIERAEVSHG